MCPALYAAALTSISTILTEGSSMCEAIQAASTRASGRVLAESIFLPPRCGSADTYLHFKDSFPKDYGTSLACERGVAVGTLGRLKPAISKKGQKADITV